VIEFAGRSSTMHRTDASSDKRSAAGRHNRIAGEKGIPNTNRWITHFTSLNVDGILTMLLEHAGEVVSREEIRKKLLDLDPAAGQELRTADLSRRQ
jgi:hypothetical protein